MELHNEIERLLEKYFEATTTTEEEAQLRAYFTAGNVRLDLQPYASMFAYYEQQKADTFTFSFPDERPKRSSRQWLSLAASAVILVSVGTFGYLNQKPADLGTFESPEEAYAETEKALELLSRQVNRGLKSVEYVNEYENTKNLIFNH